MKRLFLLLLYAISLHAQEGFFSFRIPPITPEANSYVCHSLQVNEPTSIIGFDGLNENHIAHHVLIFGCEYPGSDSPLWDCGEMSSGQSLEMERGPPCAASPTILWAYSHDSPKLELPADVAFKVGGEKSKVQHIVMQVHYMETNGEDESRDTAGVGITIRFTDSPISKEAGTMLLVTGGEIAPLSTESLETACTIDEDVTIHPFAFRTHTHKAGIDVSGWVIHENDGSDSWTLIGRRNPQLPQIFVPISNSSLVIRKGDIVAARCIMVNQSPSSIPIGSSAQDEMCNLYVMYWSEGASLKDNTCFSPGPPQYFWSTEAQLNHIPN